MLFQNFCFFFKKMIFFRFSAQKVMFYAVFAEFINIENPKK